MSDTPVVTPGQIVEGKYRVERIIGQGAMGLVAAATHLPLQQRVALKIMLGGSNATPEQTARFQREARIAGLLKSEHAGKVRNTGTLATGEPYIEMELLDGQDLARLLQTRGALSVADAVTYVLQACEAIAEAHASGVIHRDLKPANLFLTKNAGGWPCIKVLDFGVSKVEADDGKLTQTGQAIGSPLYMAPEQMMGARDVDARADVWALGTVLYELLAEVPPFAGQTVMAVSARVLRDDPTPLSQFRPDAPPGLVAVIMQCLEKGPARRWPTVAAFAAALAPYAPAGMEAYVGRVARVQGVRIEPERPTVELGAEPVKRAPTASVQGASPPAASFPELTAAVATAAAATSRQPPGVSPKARRVAVAAAIVAALAALVVASIGAMGPRNTTPVAPASVDATVATIAPPPTTASASVSPELLPLPVVPPTASPTTGLTASAASARVPASGPSQSPRGKAPLGVVAPGLTAPTPRTRPAGDIFSRGTTPNDHPSHRAASGLTAATGLTGSSRQRPRSSCGRDAFQRREETRRRRRFRAGVPQVRREPAPRSNRRDPAKHRKMLRKIGQDGIRLGSL